MQDFVLKSLESITSSFQENELAYLASTTKIELPLRDRWAYFLHKKLHKNFQISREWKRTDLAILDSGKPVLLVELKAMYSFDAALKPNDIGGFTDAMLSDENKARKLALPNTDIYTVLLATHPNGKYPKELDGIVKYVSGINKAVKELGSSNNVKTEAIAAVNNKLKSRNIVLSGTLPGGFAFGTSIDILFWVVKA
ncbi:hypothetical protein [Pseudoalteromonas spongiae]|uniref:hypothetical protein n=1 Tax=Pseudoalteromonas spongiae TaxID=298657 RepID=UPI000C2D3F4C|nr:hypothetical protein [Pseudoalteromonas spongiae]